MQEDITVKIKNSLIEIVTHVQSGDWGTPTRESLSLCGEIHAIIESN